MVAWRRRWKADPCANAEVRAEDDGARRPATTGGLFLSVFPSIMVPMFLAVVDQTIVATALPAIAASLGGVERVSWVVLAYLVATTIAAPVYGQLRDVYSGKRMMFIALAVFIAASLFCARATSIEMLAAGRVLQGLGGGGLMTLSQALIGETIPPRERARYQGYLAAVMVTSSTFGPIVGGYLTHQFGWRSIFLVNLPLGLLALLLSLRLSARPIRQQSWSFDTFGLLLFTAFIGPTLLALEQLQFMRPGALQAFFVLGSFGLAALIALIRHERRTEHPLLPIALLRQPTIWRSDALAACHGAVLVSLIAFLPIYLYIGHAATPAETGLRLLPLMLGIGFGSMATGRIVSRTGRTTIFPSIGLIFVTLSLLTLALWSRAFSPFLFGLLLLLNGLFMGTVMGVVQVVVQNAAGVTSLGAAAASVQLSRSLGAVAGTAIVGTTLFATLALSDPLSTSVFTAMIRHGPEVLARLPAAQRAVVELDIARAFRAAFLAIAAFAGLGMLIAWTIPARRLS
jgi:EmrB/QacA subfamily drug resistance transporter